jgi:hypothetical protein
MEGSVMLVLRAGGDVSEETDRGENLTTYNPCFSSVYIK